MKSMDGRTKVVKMDLWVGEGNVSLVCASWPPHFSLSESGRWHQPRDDDDQKTSRDKKKKKIKKPKQIETKKKPKKNQKKRKTKKKNTTWRTDGKKHYTPDTTN